MIGSIARRGAVEVTRRVHDEVGNGPLGMPATRPDKVIKYGIGPTAARRRQLEYRTAATRASELCSAIEIAGRGQK